MKTLQLKIREMLALIANLWQSLQNTI